MRQLIRTYTITGLHEITITDYTFTKEDVRLIIDETIAITDKKASILVSSTAKNNIVSVISGVITLASTTAALTVGDELTIEIDIDNLAKEALATANKEEILAAIPTECSDADIDHMFETTTENGYILITSGMIHPDGTIPLGVFTAVTGLTPVAIGNDEQEDVITRDWYIIVPSSMISAFGTMSLRKFMQRTKLTPIY